MKRSVFSLFMLMLFSFPQTTSAQYLKKHQWQNRILLLFAEHSENEVFQKQMAELKAYEDGLKERKLIIYQIFPKASREGLNTLNPSAPSALFSSYNSDRAPFKIILIGLDGGIKIKSNDFLPCKSLFNTIDQMPMRRNELKEKSNLH